MSKSLIKAAFWVTVSEIIFNFSAMIIHLFVGRILGPEDYGRYGLVVTLTTMVIILIGNGIPTAMSKYLSEIFETKPGMIGVIKKKALSLQTILIGSITVLFFFLAPVIAALLNDPTLTPLFQLSTLIIPAFAAASFYFYYYTGIHEFNLQAILKTLRSIMRIVSIVALAYFFHLKGSIIGYIVAPFTVFLVALLIDKLKVSRRIEKQIEEKNDNRDYIFDWKKLVDYAWPLTLFLIFYEFLISIDLYLVKGILRDDYLTGIYNGAITVGRIPYYLFYALSIILLPVISKTTFQNDHSETHKIISNSLRLMVILIFPAVILMSVFSSQILNVFYGADFLGAAQSMSILVIGVGFLTIFYIMSFVMNGAGKVKIPMWISFWGLILNTVLNYFFIRAYGIVGSALATSIASFFIMVVMLYFIRRDFGVFTETKSIVKIILASGIMYALSTFAFNGKWTFIVSAIILFVVYIILLFLLKEISVKDLQLFGKKLVTKK